MATLRYISRRISQVTPREVIQFFTHLVCIVILFLLPEVIASFGEHSNRLIIGKWLYIKPMIWVAVFYASYYFTTDPTTRRPHAVLHFSLQIVLIISLAMAALYYIWTLELPPLHGHGSLPLSPPTHIPPPHHLPPPHNAPGPHIRFLSAPALRDLLVTVLTVALGQAIKFIYKTQKIEQQKRELIVQMRDTELRELRAQLKPHFLFNTLNSIYALVDIDPHKAQTALHHLSKMLRYMLYENKSHLSLGEETGFIRHYLDLVRLRLPASVKLDVNIDLADCATLPIAPFLFINIVENACKYGSHASIPGPISINIIARDQKVTCTTTNYFDPKSEEISHGIGLSNLSRRLALLYPGRHSLTTEARNNRFITCLSIEISSPPDMSPDTLYYTHYQPINNPS